MRDKIIDESELIKLVANGDRKAYTKLYTLYIDNLYRYIYSVCRSKEVSEEIVQDIFIRIWVNRLTLINIGSFKSYMFRSAKNALLNHIKRCKVQEKALTILKPDNEECAEQADEKIIYSQYFEMAQEAINLLPEKRRQIVELRTKEDLSLDEIAAKLNISKSVVKKQLYTGMDFVRKYLYKHGELTGYIIISLYLNK